MRAKDPNVIAVERVANALGTLIDDLVLSNSPRIKVISAPLLVATKLESFNSRGEGDYAHHDMEDIVSLVDGRPELTREVNDSIPVVREFIRQEFDDLLADDNFVNQLPWHLRPDGASQGRSTLIVERLRTIAGL